MKFVLLALVASALAIAEANPTEAAFKHGKKITSNSKVGFKKLSNRNLTTRKHKAKDEPEYVDGGKPQSFGASNSNSQAGQVGSPLEPVQDYIDYNSVKAIRKASTVMLEVAQKTRVDPFLGMHKEGYADATLVDDLEESMKHLKKGEKRVSTVNSVFVALSDEIFSPEEAPESLTGNLRKAFNKAAHAYEKQFQAKMSKSNLPHPSKYLAKSILLEMQADPGSLSTTAATTALNNPVTGTKDASMTSDGNFMDPYPMATPATLSMGTQWGNGGGTFMGAQYYGAPGMGGIGTIPSPITVRNNMMGVVAPSPPVRPDGLPPPPYVQPDADDSELNNLGTSSAGATPADSTGATAPGAGSVTA